MRDWCARRCWRCESVNLAQHPGPDLAPADQEDGTDGIDQGVAMGRHSVLEISARDFLEFVASDFAIGAKHRIADRSGVDPMRIELRTVLAVTGLFNILFFVYPGPLVGAATTAAKSLF